MILNTSAEAESLIKYVPDRLGHDRRYVDSSRRIAGEVHRGITKRIRETIDCREEPGLVEPLMKR